MTVAVIDVGSNTARLLVAMPLSSGPARVHEEKAYLRLGAEIARDGRIPEEKLAQTARVVRRYARLARTLGAEQVSVLVTAPGRQAMNADALVDALARASRAPVRILSAEEEGLLAYAGAVAFGGPLAGLVAVCDVGGGSTEIVVGSPPETPSWARSFDLGALRLTTCFLHADPPTGDEVAEAREEAERLLASALAPRPHVALAVGGSARGVSRLVGAPLGEAELAEALRITTERKAAKLARSYGLDEERARVLPAGAIILGVLVRKLGVPLELARGGLREGAVSELLAGVRAATA